MSSLLVLGLLSTAALVAVLPLSVSSAGMEGTSQLTIATQMINGVSIGGYYTVLYRGGNVSAAGFTPTSFILGDNETYVVHVGNYGSCSFGYWADTGSAAPSRAVSIVGNATYTAVMDCGSARSGITVQSANQYGHVIGGFSTALSQNGSLFAAGHTTGTFSTAAGQNYTIEVGSAGGCNFSGWSDGVASNPRPVTATNGDLTYTAVYDCSTTTSSLTVDSFNQGESPVGGNYVALEQNGSVVEGGYTAAILTTTVGLTYGLWANSSGGCTFSRWSGGQSSNPLWFNATGAAQSLTAIYNCGTISPGTITVYAHRVPAPYWASCFATTCSAGTGPGATMWFVLYNSTWSVVATGFANENGYTFTGLNPNATYYLYPADCDGCHGSTHDVLFSFWGYTNSTSRPKAAIANGSSLDAWYVCTNGCSGY